MNIFFFFFSAQCSWPSWPESFTVELSHNGPIVTGNTITFKCVVKSENNPKPEEDFKYFWEDNAFPQHSGMMESRSNVFEWNITYPAHKYYPGIYELEVKVQRKIAIVFVPVGSHRVLYNITSEMCLNYIKIYVNNLNLILFLNFGVNF